MQNLWVLARWLFTRRLSKERHKLITSLLRLDRFRKLLAWAVESCYPPPLVMAAFVSPESVIHLILYIVNLSLLFLSTILR